MPSHIRISFFVTFGNQPGPLSGRLELRTGIELPARFTSRRSGSSSGTRDGVEDPAGFRIVRIAAPGADADAPCRSDSVQHHSAVHQRILRLERVGEPVELLEPGIGVVLAVPAWLGPRRR